jgi:hypothetical protein
MEKFKNSLIIVLTAIVCLLLLLRGCEKPEIKTIKEVSFKSDTIFSKDTLVKFKSIIRPKYDTIYKLDTIVEDVSSDTLFYVRKYKDSLSNDDITIYSKVKVIGILDGMDLSYKLKPKPILITNTNTVTNEVVKNPKLSIYGGLELGGNRTSFNACPYLTVNVNKSSIHYRYDLLNQTHNIGVGYKFYSSKK